MPKLYVHLKALAQNNNLFSNEKKDKKSCRRKARHKEDPGNSYWVLYNREDHFEMNFIIKIYKLAKSLVKIGTSDALRPILGPTPL